MDPIQLFTKWYQEEGTLNKIKIPSACCLSTAGLDGYPNARFVSLKEILNDCFIITGSLNTRKGYEILKNNKVALSFWWAASERQVRIQGDATKIQDELADKYFNERSQESQLVSVVSKQGSLLENTEVLKSKYEQKINEFTGKKISRPDDWGGYVIKPIRIEFLEFKENRLHERKLFERKNEQWIMKYLQP